MPDIYTGLKESCKQSPVQLPRQTANELHFVILDGDDLLNLCCWARRHDYSLCTLVASDERLLEDNVFKLYYVLSAPQGKFVILEHPLNDPQHPTRYASIHEAFPAVEPLEREATDLFGLLPHYREQGNDSGFLLHVPYPSDLYPLRRTRPLDGLKERFKNPNRKVPWSPQKLPEGVLILPVGPIHAGVIEPGFFPFHVAGEVVEDLPVRLGYKHKGIEKLFEAKYSLERGWELAERVSGDSSFAHSMAYCQAVESLAGVELAEPVHCWRALFLELERLYNHIADVGALVHDMAFDLIASPIAVLREKMVQLNHRLTGHRLLRRINRPGGVEFKQHPNLDDALNTVEAVVEQFLDLSKLVLEMPACRDRAITTGILTHQEAKDWGATGLVARASGWTGHDFRLRHPQGVYAQQVIQAILRATITPGDEEPPRRVPVFDYDLTGDVFARLALRVAEVETSRQIVRHLIEALDPGKPEFKPITDRLRAVPNFEFGLGYVEGWRGDIVYWIMKGLENTIFRCKVRDPSLFNWHVFYRAVIRKTQEDQPSKYWENILADFPLINKSFNLSYSGHDL